MMAEPKATTRRGTTKRQTRGLRDRVIPLPPRRPKQCPPAGQNEHGEHEDEDEERTRWVDSEHPYSSKIQLGPMGEPSDSVGDPSGMVNHSRCQRRPHLRHTQRGGEVSGGEGRMQT